jgi:hypothetical protein
MTPASSISFFRPEFDKFLHAPIGADGNDMPLSVLSALTRLHVDPWKEAAELSELSKNTARERLASLIARLPGGRWTQTDARTIAHRLIELLPNLDGSKAPLTEKTYRVREMTGSASAKMLICAALATAALFIAANREPSRDNLADTPTVGTTSPPQAAPPNSR